MSEHRIRFTLNGEAVDRTVPAHRLVVELLRDDLGQTGTKDGCSVGVCGLCTVQVDGVPMSACLLLATQLDGTAVRTVEGLRSLCTALEGEGHSVLTKHLLDDAVETAESALTERQVYERDINWLEGCDVLVAEASGSSFGVGFEVGYVLAKSDRTGQRVILLYRENRKPHISRLIAGNAHPRCVHVCYDDPAELPFRILEALSQRTLSQPKP